MARVEASSGMVLHLSHSPDDSILAMGQPRSSQKVRCHQLRVGGTGEHQSVCKSPRGLSQSLERVQRICSQSGSKNGVELQKLNIRKSL